MQAQNVFNGVSEDKEILRKEREQWEMEKKAKELKREAERLREMELMRRKDKAILDAQEVFFSKSHAVIQITDVPFLCAEDVEKITNAVDDPKKSVQWLALRWHPGTDGTYPRKTSCLEEWSPCCSMCWACLSLVLVSLTHIAAFLFMICNSKNENTDLLGLPTDKFVQRFGSVLYEPHQARILDQVKECFQMIHRIYATY